MSSAEAFAGPHEAFELHSIIGACLVTDGLNIFLPRVVPYPSIPESTRLLLPDTLASCRISGCIALAANMSDHGSSLEFLPVSRARGVYRPYVVNPAAYHTHIDPEYFQNSGVTWRNNQPVFKNTALEFIGYLGRL